MIAARKAAETNAMPITVMAEAEKQAAANKAEAINVLAKADANAATTRAAGVKSLGQAEAEVATLKAEARNKLSSAMIDYDLNLARINIIPDALAQAVKPIEKISDIRIFDTGSLLGRGGGGGAMDGAGGGLGLGDGLASQLLSVSAFKPIIDKILTEAGFAAGPDALTSLTNALAAQQLAHPGEPPADDTATAPQRRPTASREPARQRSAPNRDRIDERASMPPCVSASTDNRDEPAAFPCGKAAFAIQRHFAPCRETGGFGRPWDRTMRSDRILRESRHVRRPTHARLPPTFNRLAWSNLAAQSAEQIALAAAPIVAVLMLGVGEGQTGLLQTALTLPFILFAIPAGLLADRISRRWLMAGSEALRAAALLGILLLIWLGSADAALLALLGFVAVCGTVAYSVAAPALVPSLVTPEQLPAANARIELARTVAFASGPALGGVLVGWVGAAPAFGFAAALSVIAVVLLSGIYEPARAPAPRRHPLQEIKEGAAFVLHHPLLRPVFITQFIFNTASFLLLAVFVPYAVRHLGLSATGVGADARRCTASAWWSARCGDAGDAPPALRHRDRARAGHRFRRRRA